MVPSDRIAEKEPHLRAGIPREERHVRPRVSRIRIASFSRRTFSAHGVQYLRCAAGLSIAVTSRAWPARPIGFAKPATPDADHRITVASR